MDELPSNIAMSKSLTPLLRMSELTFFENEDRYPYLIKEWDSKDEGFAYHVKIFKIDYDLFNLEIGD